MLSKMSPYCYNNDQRKYEKPQHDLPGCATCCALSHQQKEQPEVVGDETECLHNGCKKNDVL